MSHLHREMKEVSLESESKRAILIAANPKSGATDRSRLVEALAERLRQDGYPVEVITDLSQLRERIETLEEVDGVEVVIGAGGDGTAGVVVSRMGPKTPFLPFPLGTENLLARQYQIRADIDQASALIKQRKCVTLDAGMANDQLFLLMVGVGFDAEVVRCVHENRTGHIHRSMYWKAIAKMVWSYRFPEMTLTIQREEPMTSAKPSKAEGVHRNACWLFVANQPCYGGGLRIAPWANPQDGLLDVCTFRYGGFWRGLLYLTMLQWQRHTRLREFDASVATSLHIESPASIAYQIDGDLGGTLPLTIRLIRNRYCMIVP